MIRESSQQNHHRGMNKFKLRKNYSMVTLKYGQVVPLQQVLSSWGGVRGLPLPFMKNILLSLAAIEKAKEFVDELREKAIEKYGKRDEEGKVIFKDNAPVLENEEEANAEWATLMEETFEAPGLKLSDVDANAGKLDLNLAQFNVLVDIDGPYSLLIDDVVEKK